MRSKHFQKNDDDMLIENAKNKIWQVDDKVADFI
jgi:hypothetical protein